MLYRTLLIGLGGTGVDVLRKFKTYHVQTTSPEEREHIKLIGIDTIQQEGETDELLSPDEFLHLAKARLNTPMIKRYQDEPYLSWTKDNLPYFNVHEGAGQKRLAGYLAYLWQGAEVRHRIEKAIRDLYAPQITDRLRGIQDGASTRVYIISSICGGTGTGMFLDVSYLVKSIFETQQLNAKRFGFLFLPSAFPKLVSDPHIAKGIRANGYAALEELNYYMQQSFKEQTLPAHGRMLPVTGSAFDLCFLVGGQTERGNLVGTVDELYKRTANFIYTSVAFSRISTKLVGIFAVNPYGNYCAVGSLTLPLPQSAFTERYTIDMGREILADLFSQTAEQRFDVDDFLAGTRFIEAAHPERSQLVADVQKKIDQEVFIHGRPTSHDQADQWMREEALAAKNLDAHTRERLAAEARQVVSDVALHLDEGVSGSIVRGVLASRLQLLKELSQRLLEASSRLNGAIGSPIDEALSSSLKRPGIFSKTSPESRMSAFQSSLASAIETSVAGAFSAELKQQLERLRAEIISRISATASLLGEYDVVLDRFMSKTAAFLKLRRRNDAGDALADTDFGRDLTPDDRYQESRVALLNVCRSEIKLEHVLRDPAILNLDSFIDQIYRVAGAWVKEKVTLSQALDSEGFERGLNQAWTSLQLSASPGGRVNTDNVVFVPNDLALQDQIATRFKKWDGAAGSTPEIEHLADVSAVMLIRLRTGFNLGDLLEIDELQKAYQAAMQDSQKAPFLKIPPHNRRPLRYENESQTKAETFALALAIGVLEEFGRNFRFNGRLLLLEDENDPVVRRRKAYDLLLEPDRAQSVVQFRDKKLNEFGQKAFGALLKQQYQEKYGDIQGPSELKDLLENERRALADYCASIGTYVA